MFSLTSSSLGYSECTVQRQDKIHGLNFSFTHSLTLSEQK